MGSLQYLPIWILWYWLMVGHLMPWFYPSAINWTNQCTCWNYLVVMKKDALDLAEDRCIDSPICLACTMAKMLQWWSSYYCFTPLFHAQMMMLWKRFFMLLVISSLLSASFGSLDWRIRQGPYCYWFETKSEKSLFTFYYSLITVHRLLFTFHCSLVLITTLFMPI